MGLTGFAEKEETADRSERLKCELSKQIERLWTWARQTNAYGSLEFRVTFEDGIAQTLEVMPRQTIK